SLKKYGVRLIVHPYLTQFSGLLLSHRQTKYYFKDLRYRNEILKSLIDSLEKDHKIIVLSLPPELIDIRMFSWKQYDNSVKYTFRKNLKEQEEILKNVDPEIIRKIKKAEKQNFYWDRGSTEKLIKDFYHLQSLSLSRQRHNNKFNLDNFISLVLSLKRVPFNILFYVVYKSNTPIAGLTILTFRETAYNWLAGVNPEYFNTGVNQFLMRNVIQDLCLNQIKYFDLVGANTPGVADYKATYNFDLIPYYGVKKTIGLYPKILMKLKETLF
ncbi:MAG: GNAT family N-acetyltransferase, partial [Bacteroidales bacterium]